ncbi:MAG: ATP-binding protein [Candidatus Gracilibacteria bacterium]|nr:ATP-binding protein [Candidatus Gracilibacteria bacterium]
MSALEKKLLKKLRHAITDFEMIKAGETVLLGVSGGKDSMVLGYLLSQYRKIAKDKFDIRAVYIFKDFLIDCDINFEEKRKYFEEELEIPLEKVILSLPAESKLNEGLGLNCQWCAYARRIAMFKLCEKYGATKIIYGHHMDDIVVTTFMNMAQGRKLKIMPPKNKMNLGDITFIRPLAYIREKEILRFAQINNIPFSSCNCPVGSDGMRNKIKHQIVWENEKVIPKFVENIFWALIKDFKDKYEKDGYSM